MNLIQSSTPEMVLHHSLEFGKCLQSTNNLRREIHLALQNKPFRRHPRNFALCMSVRWDRQETFGTGRSAQIPLRAACYSLLTDGTTTLSVTTKA